jgi:hypothetical protein
MPSKRLKILILGKKLNGLGKKDPKKLLSDTDYDIN